MKKNFLYSMILMLATIFVTSCEDNSTEGLTRITYYPSITLLDGDVTVVNVGETYSDPGCEVILNGEDISDQVEVSSNVNTSKPGIYTVTYTAVNPDGFSKSSKRTVYVVSEREFSNVYLGESQFGSRHYYNAPIIISDNGDGTYEIDDILGGFYFNGRYPGYEPTYDFHAEATLSLGTDNVVSLLNVGSWYFDSDPISIVEGTFDPTTGNVVLTLDFAGDPAYVNLTPITK